jgi:heme-degrading monooxygenase HmoA
MIHEMAYIDVIPGKEAEFEQGVAAAVPIFHRARGCHGVSLHKTIEQPNRYLLLVDWDTVEDHMVHFRNSDDFQQWRSLVGPYFQGAPTVVHTEVRVPK